MQQHKTKENQIMLDYDRYNYVQYMEMFVYTIKY